MSAPAIAEGCTGAELVAALRSHAFENGIGVTELAARLSSSPGRWLGQVRAAQRPKPHTVERVRALIAGEFVPPPPLNNFQAADGNGVKTRTIRRLLGEGRTVEEVVAEAGASHGYVVQIVHADAPFAPISGSELATRDDADAASARLCAAIAAEAQAAASRRAIARSTGTIRRVVPAPEPAPPAAASGAGDRRPRAESRDACTWCGTRGDLGCAHQRGFVFEGVPA